MFFSRFFFVLWLAVVPFCSCEPYPIGTYLKDSVVDVVTSLKEYLLGNSLVNLQPVKVSTEYFQGWFFRNVDHSANVSFVVIAGSFSPRGSASFSSHYLFAAVSRGDGKGALAERRADAIRVEAFPVSVAAHSRPGRRTHVNWTSEFGGFEIEDSRCTGAFAFANGLRVSFSMRAPVPWSAPAPAGSPKARVNGWRQWLAGAGDGPEGWLHHSPLLPLRYHVFAVASVCEYDLAAPSRAFALPSLESEKAREKEKEKEEEEEEEKEEEKEEVKEEVKEEEEEEEVQLRGVGSMHIEENYGTMFPSGWVWMQASTSKHSLARASGGEVEKEVEEDVSSLVMTAGRFSIGFISPLSLVLYFRWGRGFCQNNTESGWWWRGDCATTLRSTDGARFQFKLDGQTGSVTMRASSLLPHVRIDLEARPSGEAEKEGEREHFVRDSHEFGGKQNLHIPTKEGFKSQPGCRESYLGTASVVLSMYNSVRGKYEIKEKRDFSLAAIEFGADFISQVVTNLKEKQTIAGEDVEMEL